MRRRTALACMLALSLGACTGSDRIRGEATPSATAQPQRIVSQAVLADEILWGLGPDVRGRVAGVSHFVDDRRYSTVAGQWPETIPRVPPSSEAIAALEPSLVIAASFTTAEVRALLEQMGIRTLTLDGFAGFDDYRRHVAEIAVAVGAPAAGEALVARFDARLRELTTRARDVATRTQDVPPPSIVSWHDQNVAGSGTTFDAEARAAGFRNAAAEHGVAGHARISIEQLLAWDPDYVVISCEDDCERARTRLAERDGLSALRAVARGGVVTVPPQALYATGHAMLDVVDLLVGARGSSEGAP